MINDFLESEIRKRILSKVDPSKISKSGKHWKGYVYVDGVLITKVKIPNDHNRVMHKSKSQYIARDLKLTENEFNGLIECHFKSVDYYNKMKTLK